MKVSAMLPFDRPEHSSDFWRADAVVAVGQALERVGFSGGCVTDHPAPTGRWLDDGGHNAQDPFVMLSLLAAATATLELQTGILVLPYRNPFLTARAVTTLDRFSGGRVALGVGAGYLKGEFRALGVDFARRNEITDEYLLALKQAWLGDEFALKGDGYEAFGNRIIPGVLRKPHPPLLIGGNSHRAIRRAVEHGDAWNPFFTTGLVSVAARTAELSGIDALAQGIDYMHEHCDRIGRVTPPRIVVAGLTDGGVEWRADEVLQRISRLESLGVTGVGVQLSGKNVQEWCDESERFGSEVIAYLG